MSNPNKPHNQVLLTPKEATLPKQTNSATDFLSGRYHFMAGPVVPVRNQVIYDGDLTIYQAVVADSENEPDEPIITQLLKPLL